MRLTFPAEGRTWSQAQRQLRNLVNLPSSSCRIIHWEQSSTLKKTSPNLSSSAFRGCLPLVEGENASEHLKCPNRLQMRPCTSAASSLALEKRKDSAFPCTDGGLIRLSSSTWVFSTNPISLHSLGWLFITRESGKVVSPCGCWRAATLLGAGL